ncbi:preprotein translocase subunit SecA [Candidatus Phytoplasma pyri]|uniref:preprotein translocase subunit SecA n=1 Tax=Candidatus Phytoplasma pyri TaxID=47566 RepID=UPI0039834142
MFNILKKIFNSSRKYLKKAKILADKINQLDEKMANLKDEDFKKETQRLKNIFCQKKNLDELLVEAYALAREASYRITGMKPYYVQLLGAIILHQGNVAEMKTGEGKTLTAIMPSYLNSLSGQSVHIVTVNEYLASREAEGIISKVFNFLGLSVGLNTKNKNNIEKKQAYDCDILYSTNSELSFDYLKDNMQIDRKNLVMQRDYFYAIVDEVDSILIDEARTPLIISSQDIKTKFIYREADRFVRTLKNNHYIIDLETKTIELTEKGINKAENFFQINNLYNINHAQLLHRIKNALKAFFLMHNNKDYLVVKDKILIIDEFTGRILKGRQFSNGLHQALEAKERVTIKPETTISATITYQNFFRLYKKISGMTGTAKTEEDEFRNIYNMEVVEIPTNKPMIRIDDPDFIFTNLNEKWKYLIEDVKNRHKKGQPVLIGTITVEISEQISKKLYKQNITHEVLNAKNHMREAEIISKAGVKGAVTIATNMAGRGTDIILGEGVIELGGLAVIGTEKHESRRIDNQLRGRAGRQGDPGYSRFFISGEDDLLQRFGGSKLQYIIELLKKINTSDNKITSSKLITKFLVNVQKKIESSNFDYRKYILKYDDILRIQREIIYKQRKEVLFCEEIKKLALDLVEKNLNYQIIYYFKNSNTNLKKQNYLEDLINYLELHFFNKNILNLTELKQLVENNKNFNNEKIIIDYIKNKARNVLLFPHKDLISENQQNFIEKTRLKILKIIDHYWSLHITNMEYLRKGASFLNYGQQNSLIAYQKEGRTLFNQMIKQISFDITKILLKMPN